MVLNLILLLRWPTGSETRGFGIRRTLQSSMMRLTCTQGCQLPVCLQRRAKPTPQSHQSQVHNLIQSNRFQYSTSWSTLVWLHIMNTTPSSYILTTGGCPAPCYTPDGSWWGRSAPFTVSMWVVMVTLCCYSYTLSNWVAMVTALPIVCRLHQQLDKKTTLWLNMKGSINRDIYLKVNVNLANILTTSK